MYQTTRDAIPFVRNSSFIGCNRL